MRSRLLLMSALLAASAAVPAAQAADQTVTAGDFFYRAYRVQVDPGDTVTWQMAPGSPHTVTTRPSAPEQFDSGTLEEGQTYAQTLIAVGRYPYFCTLHPGLMDGVVQVGPDSTPPALGRLKAKAGARGVRITFRLGEEAKVKAVLSRGRRKLKTVRTRELRPGARSVVLRRKALRRGRYVVKVTAVDPAGNAVRPARKPFRVR